MGDERSASVNRTNSPRAASTPRRTLYPLPRFGSLRRMRTQGKPEANFRRISGVGSVDPSSTRMSSVTKGLDWIYSRIFSRELPIRRASLYAGITMLKYGSDIEREYRPDLTYFATLPCQLIQPGLSGHPYLPMRGTNMQGSRTRFVIWSPSLVKRYRSWRAMSPRGMTSRPPFASCAKSGGGTSGAAAVTMM